MPNNLVFETKGFEEFEKALLRSPKLVIAESKKLIQRMIAEYKRGIINNPWTVGASGGGAPVNTGNLRDTHKTLFPSPFIGEIYPTADYAEHVHKKRPWLDFVFDNKMRDIEKLEDEFLTNIVKDLAR